MPMRHDWTLCLRLHIAICPLRLSRALSWMVQRPEVCGAGWLLIRLVYLVVVMRLWIRITGCRLLLDTRVHSIWRPSDFLAKA